MKSFRINQLFFSLRSSSEEIFNLLKPTGHVMHKQVNIQQLHLCVLYLSENKQRLVPLTA